MRMEQLLRQILAPRDSEKDIFVDILGVCLLLVKDYVEFVR